MHHAGIALFDPRTSRVLRMALVRMAMRNRLRAGIERSDDRPMSKLKCLEELFDGRHIDCEIIISGVS
jgi:hypothetical protein